MVFVPLHIVQFCRQHKSWDGSLGTETAQTSPIFQNSPTWRCSVGVRCVVVSLQKMSTRLWYHNLTFKFSWRCLKNNFWNSPSQQLLGAFAHRAACTTWTDWLSWIKGYPVYSEGKVVGYSPSGLYQKRRERDYPLSCNSLLYVIIFTQTINNTLGQTTSLITAREIQCFLIFLPRRQSIGFVNTPIS